MCYHSDYFQEFICVAGGMHVSLSQVCRNVDGSLQFISPLRQALFCYIALHLLLNQKKRHTIDAVDFNLKGFLHTRYNT